MSENIPLPYPIAALIAGDYEHHLDHLAPLSSWLDIPLFITEKKLFELGQKFYPNIQIHYLPITEFATSLSHFHGVVSCLPIQIMQGQLATAQNLSNGPIRSIWCPHGNSDKGINTPFMEALKHEEYALLYGNKIADFLKEKGAYANLKQMSLIGNYRFEYFKAHQKPIDRTVKPTILYAPSWQPKEHTHLFIREIETLANLSEYEIIIKLHPNTLKLGDPYLLRTLLNIEVNPHIRMLEQTPTIYPILASTDLLIGDISSIGYDFLAFDKPMIFIEDNKKAHQSRQMPLYSCGKIISHQELGNLTQVLKEELISSGERFAQARQELYEYTFAKLEAGVDFKAWIAGQAANIISHF